MRLNKTLKRIKSDPIKIINEELGDYSFIIGGATNIFEAFSKIKQFIDLWNQQDESDPIRFDMDRLIGDLMGFVTEMKFDARSPLSTKWLSLPEDKDIDTGVCFVGSDSMEMSFSSQLVDGIDSFQKSKHGNEPTFPMFLTLDLHKNETEYTENDNDLFMKKLTSPYIKICHRFIVQSIIDGTIENEFASLEEGLISNTMREVCYLMQEKHYVFVEPDLLLSPVLLETGVDPRRLERMGLGSDQIQLIMADWGMVGEGKTRLLHSLSEFSEIPILAGAKPVARFKEIPPLTIFLNQTQRLIVIQEVPQIPIVMEPDRTQEATIPFQMLFLSPDGVLPKFPIWREGWDTLQCQVSVEPVETPEFELQSIELFLLVPKPRVLDTWQKGKDQPLHGTPGPRHFGGSSHGTPGPWHFGGSSHGTPGPWRPGATSSGTSSPQDPAAKYGSAKGITPRNPPRK